MSLLQRYLAIIPMGAGFIALLQTGDWPIALAICLGGFFFTALIGLLIESHIRGALDPVVTNEQDAENLAEGKYWIFLRSFEREHEVVAKVAPANPGIGETDLQEITLSDVVSRSARLWGCRLHVIGGSGDGASRIRTNDDTWQVLATKLMERAKLIVIVPGSTEGTHWEMQRASSAAFRGKTVVIVPPIRGWMSHSREPDWGARTGLYASLRSLGIVKGDIEDLPPSGGLFVISAEGELTQLPEISFDFRHAGKTHKTKVNPLEIRDGSLTGLGHLSPWVAERHGAASP